MKRAWFIVVGGLVLALAAYAGIYFAGTARQRAMENSNQPALAWLQQEYHLSDTQFVRVRELYASYEPQCAERCRKIDEENAKVEKLLASTNAMTSEIKTALEESARLRAECQTAMLSHFYEVAKVMPPEEGKRYLAWVQRETLTPAQMMPTKGPSTTDSP